MKLELKHLAPYLPYDIKFLQPEIEPISFIYNGRTESVEIMGAVTMLSIIKNQYKPTLRPLSDLNKYQIKLEFGDSIIIDWIKENVNKSSSEVIRMIVSKRLPYKYYSLLIEHHFDVFGLIEKGLAIDINTLK